MNSSILDRWAIKDLFIKKIDGCLNLKLNMILY